MSIVKKKLMIEGMHCSSCAMNIDFDLEDIDGVISAKTRYAKGECEVEYDDQKVTMEEIMRQIEKTGYKAFCKQ
jgi:Cu+-exporting ATPase